MPEFKKADNILKSITGEREKAVSDQEDYNYRRDTKGGAKKPSGGEIEDYKREKARLTRSLLGVFSGKGYEKAKKEAIQKFNRRYRTLELYLKQNPSFKL